jgi:hypothetical protein
VVQTFAPHAPEKSFTGSVHVRRPDGSLDDPSADGLGNAVEVVTELVVPVTDEESRSDAESRRREVAAQSTAAWEPALPRPARPRASQG